MSKVPLRVALLCGMVIAAAAVVSDLQGHPSRPGVDAYLQRRQNVIDALQDSFHNPHPSVADSFSTDDAGTITWPAISKDHTRRSLNAGGYTRPELSRYLIRLPIATASVNTARQRNSQTMLATEVLHHYLDILEEHNLQFRSSPMVAMGDGVQYAAGTWIPSEEYEGRVTADRPIWVEAEVFYAMHAGTMIVRLTVGGRYTP